MVIQVNEKSVLSKVLRRLGWSHEAVTSSNRVHLGNGRIVRDASGAVVGQLTCFQAWDALHERGLVRS